MEATGGRDPDACWLEGRCSLTPVRVRHRSFLSPECVCMVRPAAGPLHVSTLVFGCFSLWCDRVIVLTRRPGHPEATQPWMSSHQPPPPPTMPTPAGLPLTPSAPRLRNRRMPRTRSFSTPQDVAARPRVLVIQGSLALGSSHLGSSLPQRMPPRVCWRLHLACSSVLTDCQCGRPWVGVDAASWLQLRSCPGWQHVRDLFLH